MSNKGCNGYAQREPDVRAPPGAVVVRFVAEGAIVLLGRRVLLRGEDRGCVAIAAEHAALKQGRPYFIHADWDLSAGLKRG